MRHRTESPLPYARPRPNDRRTGRPAQSAGGTPYAGRVHGGQPPVEHAGPPAATNDALISRRRGPWLHTSAMTPIAAPLRATESGPIRPELHLWRSNYRRWQGSSGAVQEGWHTMMPPPVPTRARPSWRLPGWPLGTWYRGQAASAQGG